MKKQYRIHLYILSLFIVFLTFVLVGCENEIDNLEIEEEFVTVEHKWRKKKIKICHTGRNGHCRIIKVSRRAWKAHKRHGDVRLDDRDGDGYVPDNACGFGQMGDCDDRDSSMNPGIVGSCGGEIDSDGDGVPDSEDECPEEIGIPALNGCPDVDGDGIADKDDDCPFEAGPATNNGCPEMVFQIGDIHAGGYIFYLAGPNEDLNSDGIADHGLVAALTDIRKAEWGCDETDIDGASGLTIGFGSTNTKAIINNICQINDGVISAAELCANFEDGIYDDWFLPSGDELVLMFVRLADSDGNGVNLEPSDPNNIGGFLTDSYWSSYNESDYTAMDISFKNGDAFVRTDKSLENSVRPVRVF